MGQGRILGIRRAPSTSLGISPADSHPSTRKPRVPGVPANARKTAQLRRALLPQAGLTLAQEDRRRDCRYHLTETLQNFLISVVSVIRGKFGFLCNGGTSQNLCLLRAPTGTLKLTVCLK